jgi:hypothetical protein
MNDDYLWDRSGEPDPEIQQLEEILGTLRYQPRPLEIPEQQQTSRRRFYSPRLAIAAAVAMMVVGLGLWIGLNRPDTQLASESIDQQKVRDLIVKAKGLVAGSISPDQERPAQQANDPEKKLFVAGSRSRPQRSVARDTKLAASERAEGRAARDDLMLALRLTSSKLSFVQKKVQGTNPGNTVHNQHKIG